MNNRHLFTRADVIAFVCDVYARKLAVDEKVSIGQAVRLRNVSPPVWIVDFSHHTGQGADYYVYHDKAVVSTGKDKDGNLVLKLPDTIILPEEVQEEKKVEIHQ